MHTVFINTTKNKIGGRFDSLKNAKDLKKLMCVECPLDTWYDGENGYRKAAKEIAEYIDDYNDVSNDYNLIVYVDMFGFFNIMKINFFDKDGVEQTFLSNLCKCAISRMITSTILKELNEDGRTPSEKPVLLLELPITKDEPSGIDTTKRKTEAMCSLLHLVSMDQLQQRLACEHGENSVQLSAIVDEVQPRLTIDLCQIYKKSMENMANSVAIDGLPLQRACNNLYDAIVKTFDIDCAGDIAISEYYTNKKTQRLSLEVYTKHNFLLQCFILDCINDKTAFNEGKQVKQIPILSSAEWDVVKEVLYKKKRTYEAEQQKVSGLRDSFIKLKMVPSLYAPAREKFGLNESGNIQSEYVVGKVENKPKKNKSKEAEQNDSLAEKEEELVEQKGCVLNWITEDEDTPYDAQGDKYKAPFGKATADEYCERAVDLANHHLNLFDKLSMHIKRAMVNYAGRSILNTPPILRKRSVNIGQNIDESEKNDYKYAQRSGTQLVPEKEATETVIKTAKRSYVSILMEYLKFDAGRGITLINIKEQCDWFINRIRKIEESLKKLFWILVILCITLGLVYLPFVLIQWHSIVKNIDTLLIALSSLAVPYVLLFVFYFIARLVQKQKMKRAWEDLVKKSDEASKANHNTIQSYDLLMTRYIPALRWLYEYVLDVDFHCDCCNFAQAKLNHHKMKLGELIESLGNFLEDLDYLGDDYSPLGSEQRVDYNKSFCEGDKNYDFYSIIDKKLLDLVQRGGLK